VGAGGGFVWRVFVGFLRLSGRWEQVPKKYQKRPGEVGRK
jgi:hypothetical protein